MKMRGVGLQLVLASVVLTLAKGALARAETPSALPVRTLQVSDIFIPEELGYVVERHEPTVANPHPFIMVHIQEAHTNYEGQQHLVGILERLVERYGLTLILVEGGEGDVSLSYLRSYGSPDNRREVADKYLAAGIISGEEYLDIVSDYPLVLWGVEHKDLYERNLETFLEVKGLLGSLSPILASVREAIEALTPRLSSPALMKLEASSQAFEQGELDLGEYVNTLATLAGRRAISEDTYPNLHRFLEARRLERAIDLNQVPTEQQALIAQLSRRVDEERLERLVAQALQMKAGKVTRAEFYTSLEQLATASNINLERSPNLSGYIYYVKRSAQIQPPRLAEELEELATSLQERLVETPESRQLLTLVQQLDLMEKLLALRLSPTEYQQFTSLNLEDVFATWKVFLTDQLRQQGLASHSFDRLHEFNAKVVRLRRFYDMALLRDQALVDNALAKFGETNERLAVLITGGFHSPQVTQLLKEQGFGVVVVAPKVSKATDERLYEAVLKYKSGHGSFEEVMAIANQATSAVEVR